MDPRVVAARFTALVWSSERNRQDREAAVRFAKDNWPAFLPLAQEGLGRLLLKIATPPAPQHDAGACARPEG